MAEPAIGSPRIYSEKITLNNIEPCKVTKSNLPVLKKIIRWSIRICLLDRVHTIMKEHIEFTGAGDDHRHGIVEEYVKGTCYII